MVTLVLLSTKLFSILQVSGFDEGMFVNFSVQGIHRNKRFSKRSKHIWKRDV